MTKNTGVITRLIRYSVKEHGGELLESAFFRAGTGMDGDFHAVGGERQISLLSAESREWMAASSEQGLCFSRFKENLTVRGIALEKIKAGNRLAVGEVILEISGILKHCHEECPLFSTGSICRLAGQSLFAKVVTGGEVRVGMRVKADGL